MNSFRDQQFATTGFKHGTAIDSSTVGLSKARTLA